MDSPKIDLTIDFQPTGWEYRRAARAMSGKIWGRYLFYWCLAAGLFAIAYLLTDSGRPLFIGMALPCIFMALYGPSAYTAQVAKSWSRSVTSREKTTLIFSEDCLAIQSASQYLSRRWTAIPRWTENSQFILIYFSSGSAQYIPKRCLNDSQLNHVRAILFHVITREKFSDTRPAFPVKLIKPK